MGSNQVLKKSVFGGFNKEKVLGYVEQLQAEILGLKKELAAKNADSSEIAKLNKENAELKKQLESVKEENKVLSEENESQLRMNAEYALRMEEYEASAKEYQSMLDECVAHFEEIEKQFSQLEEAYNKRMLTDGDSSQRERMVSKATAEIEEINDRLESSFTNFDAAVGDLRSNTSDIMAAFKSFEEMFAKANIEDML